MAKRWFPNITSHLTNLFQEGSGKLVDSPIYLPKSIHPYWRTGTVTPAPNRDCHSSTRKHPHQQSLPGGFLDGLLDQWPWSVPSDTSPQPGKTDESWIGACPKSSQWAAKNLWNVLARRPCPIWNDGGLQSGSNSPYQKFKVKIQGKSNLGTRRERLRSGDTDGEALE